MKVLVEQPHSYSRKVDVTVPVARVDAAYAQALDGLRGRVRLKGFRKGRVPAKVLYKRYKKAIDGEVMGRLLNEAVTEVFERPDLDPVGQPEIDSRPCGMGSEFNFSLTFEVLPTLELGDLDNIEVTLPPLAVADEAIDARLEALRQGDAQERVVEGRTQPQLGDVVVFDQAVLREGEEPHTHEGASVTLEEGGRLPESLLKTLVGCSVDETVAYEPDPPEGVEPDANAPRFEITLRQIKERLLPDVDDEWARDHDYDTLEEFRGATRAELMAQAESERNEKLDEAVLDVLVARQEIEIPPDLAKRQVAQRVETLERIFAGGLSGQDPSGSLFEGMRRETRDRVHREIRRAIVLAAVRRDQSIEVSDEDVAARVTKVASESKEPPAKVRARLATPEAKDRIRTELVNEAALAFLKARTTIIEQEPAVEQSDTEADAEPEGGDAPVEPAPPAADEQPAGE